MSKLECVKVPAGFSDYSFDNDFKLMMLCLEITRNQCSGEVDDYIKDTVKEWGYKSPQEVYDLLWYRFKYYKGAQFDKQFSLVQSQVNCPHCHHEVPMVEVWPKNLLQETEVKK